VEVPERNEISLSGLSVRVYDPGGAAKLSLDPQESESERSFRKSLSLQVIYSVFNPLTDDKKQVHVEVKTLVYARGHAVFVGTPSQVTYPVEPGIRRQISTRLALGPTIASGDYILEVTVIDKNALPGAPRTASRFIDFHLRD
jgi:hypothetical protein